MPRAASAGWKRLAACAAVVASVLAGASDAGAQHHFTTPADTIPNFALTPTRVSVASGAWSNPGIWSPAGVPTGADVVSIRHDVVYDSLSGVADVIGIAANARLRFATNQGTRLKVGVLMVLPSGTLEIGTAAQPVDAGVVAEIVIANRPLNGSIDPNQWGTGLISMDGKVTMHGAPKTPTFVRVAAEPLAGQTTIQFSTPVAGWRAGDQVFVPDSRQPTENDKFNSGYQLQVDRVTVQSVAPDGRSITVTPLAYNHRGARDANGAATVLSDGTRFLPHVGNLTRNVVIRSENPGGTRGHTAYTHHSDVHIAYVQFQDLGRTRAEEINTSSNLKGRYPLHIHHLWGPANPSNTGYQFEVIGNAVNDSLKWPLAVHGSHFGLIQQNVIFGGAQLTGAGIAVEDGSETDNLFDSNFVAVVRGDVNPRESGSDTDTPGSGGECYWTAGFNNRFVNNVASDCRNPYQQVASGPGFKMFTPAAPYTAQNPRFRGADMSNASQTISVTPQMQPLLEFRGNEVYGGTSSGLTIWHLGTDGYNKPTMAESVVRDFRVWNVHESALWNYPMNRLTVENLEHRVDAAQNPYSAIQSDDYRVIDLTVRGGNVHATGVWGNADAPMGTIRIENVRAITRGHAFNFITPGTPGTQAGIPSSPGITVVLRNNQITPWPGRSLQTVSTDYFVDSFRYPQVRYEIFVQDYQGQAGNNFRVYWREQGTQTIAGGRAPCTDTSTRPEVDGITCTGGSPGPPPVGSTPVACAVSAWGAWQPLTSWSACTSNQQARGEQRLRSILTYPQNGGAACPALQETRTATRACTPQPPASAEVCGDAIDNDGDGLVDENCTAGALRAPAAPRRLWRLVRGSTVTLGWRAPISGGPPGGYVVEAGLASGQPMLSFPVGLATSVQVPGVAPGKYFVRVRAANATGTSDPSNEVAVSVGCGSPPSGPRALSSTTSGSLVNLTWVDDDGCNDTSYVMGVGSVPGAANIVVAPAEISELAAAAPPGTYYARVATVSPFGMTAVSNEIGITINSASCPAPTFPIGLDAQVAGTQVILLWGPANEAAAFAADDVSPVSYVLEAGTAPGLANLGTFPMGRTTAFATSVPAGNYYVRIRGVNVCGAGAASNEFIVQVR